jgi:Zn-dependent peptidase ImmA (M78 family)
VEVLCNAIAAEILVPHNTFIQQWREKFHYDHEKIIASIAAYFRCGRTVIARKALTNDYIGIQEYKEIARDAIRHFDQLQGKRKEEESGGNYYNTAASRMDERFLDAIAGSIQEGKTLYSEAFRLTHTNRKTFSNLLIKIRGVE